MAARARPYRLAGLAAGVLVAAVPATARITFSPPTVLAGSAVVIAGAVPTTCPARVAVVLTSAPAFFPPHGTGPQAVRSPSGAFRVRYQVPATTAADTYGVGVRCGGTIVGEGRVRVLEHFRHVPAGANAAPGAGRWLIGMGTLLMGAGISIGVAELASWRGRRR